MLLVFYLRVYFLAQVIESLCFDDKAPDNWEKMLARACITGKPAPNGRSCVSGAFPLFY